MNSRSEQFNKFLEHYYSYILAIVLGVVFLAMLNFFIWPQYQTMQSAGILQYRTSADVVAQRRNYLTQLQTMKTEYESLDKRIVRSIDLALPTEYSEGPVYAEIEHLLDGTKFTIDTVNIVTNSSTATLDAAGATTEVVTNDVYEEVLLSLNVVAIDSSTSYADFKTLLQHIEQNPHLMNLDSVIYTPDNSSYTLVLKTYQRKQSL